MSVEAVHAVRAAALRIRPAQSHDVPALFAMMRALATHEGSAHLLHTDAERLQRDGFGAQPRFGAFLAELDSVAVGFVSYTVNYQIWAGGDVIAIDDLYVAPTVRSRGVGAQLMQAVAAKCLREGGAHVRWTVELSNTRGIAFYERLGAAVRAKGLCLWRPQREQQADAGSLDV